MSKKRKDEVSKLYDITNKLSNIGNILFLINIFLTFTLSFNFKYRNIAIIASIVLTISYVVIININEMYFNNRAENERRKSLLKESFDAPITLNETNKYYNNKELPSVEKLGLNSYESVFFTKNVVDKMIVKNLLKMIILIIVYIILMIRLENLDILLIITQTLFSSEFIFYFVKLIYYKFQLEKINNEFQNIFFITKKNDKNRNILIIDAVMGYECLKSYCELSTSSQIFFDNNDKWSKEWEKILKKMKKEGKDNG
jgi:putative uncharacterized protein ORF00028